MNPSPDSAGVPGLPEAPLRGTSARVRVLFHLLGQRDPPPVDFPNTQAAVREMRANKDAAAAVVSVAGDPEMLRLEDWVDASNEDAKRTALGDVVMLWELTIASVDGPGWRLVYRRRPHARIAPAALPSLLARG